VYKRLIYQIAESNRIENRFGSENRIKSNRNFFARIGMLYRIAHAGLRSNLFRQDHPASCQSCGPVAVPVTKPFRDETDLARKPNSELPRKRYSTADAGLLCLRPAGGGGGTSGVDWPLHTRRRQCREHHITGFAVQYLIYLIKTVTRTVGKVAHTRLPRVGFLS